MRESAAVGGALCLMRFLPLLDVLASPVRRPVDDVIRGCLHSGGIADGVLISLDEYSEARGPRQDFDRPDYFEQTIADIALLTAGAGRTRSFSANTSANERAVEMWDVLARLMNERTQGSTPSVITDFAERERCAQREDEQALAVREHDPTAVTRRADQLASAVAATTAELSKVSAALGWRPSGPCGPPCTWPVCAPAAADCVRHRPFRPQQTLAARLRRKPGAEPRPWYVISLHFLADDDEPFEFVTEVGADGYEVRKVAQYVDGRLVRVDRDHPLQGPGRARVGARSVMDGARGRRGRARRGGVRGVLRTTLAGGAHGLHRGVPPVRDLT
ncbi:hypothetical protein [Kitasatospora arboriphila]|uniref:Uncharacterized protein n=1 Tax=Kitasatospora arboriphila TaxID=258052 RepID=A0ABP4EMZ0_9ACTN